MKGTQKKPNQKKEFMIWLAAIMLVVIGIASSSMSRQHSASDLTKRKPSEKKAKGSAKLRRAIKRGTAVHRPKRNKYQTYADAHRAASRSYYQRNREKVLAYQKEHYRAKKEAQA